MDDGVPEQPTLEILPTGDTCDKCSNVGGLHSYDGGEYCDDCLNQLMEMQ